ncbi:MAG: NAD(P)/FAD-dependent oxidoreductase, partial [Myxococcales bacterium]
AALRLLGRSAHDVVHQHVPDERFVAIFTSLWAYLGLPPAELCALTFAQAWASYHRGGCYYVEGGGQALSNAFVSVIEAGGGQVLMKCPVVSIETARGTVTGAVTGRHGDLFAPVVISNASAPDTFRRLLRAPASPAPATRTATSEVAATTSIVETYVGLRGRAEELGFPDRLLFTMADYDCQGQWNAVMRGDIRGVPTVVANHNLSDPRHVPRGRSILNVAVLANGAEWMDLDDDVYATRKREVENQLLEVLAARLPDLRDRLEICETGTPRTMKRYSWNPDGSIYGLPPSARTHPLRRPGPRTDITGLYLAGAWTFPAGGFHGAITSGLHTAGLVAADLAGARRQASRET